MEQLDPDMGFQERDRAADRRRRPPKQASGARKAALIERRDEDLHGLNAVHHLTIKIIPDIGRVYVERRLFIRRSR